jgi:hypothetical protein
MLRVLLDSVPEIIKAEIRTCNEPSTKFQTNTNVSYDTTIGHRSVNTRCAATCGRGIDNNMVRNPPKGGARQQQFARVHIGQRGQRGDGGCCVHGCLDRVARVRVDRRDGERAAGHGRTCRGRRVPQRVESDNLQKVNRHATALKIESFVRWWNGAWGWYRIQNAVAARGISHTVKNGEEGVQLVHNVTLHGLSSPVRHRRRYN